MVKVDASDHACRQPLILHIHSNLLCDATCALRRVTSDEEGNLSGTYYFCKTSLTCIDRLGTALPQCV